MLLLGPDRNANFHVSAREQEAATVAMDAADTMSSAAAGIDADFLPWFYYLTPYSAEQNRDRNGRRRIYLNDPNLGRRHNFGGQCSAP